MRFRTEVEIRPSAAPIVAGERLVTVGSCFSDAIGRRLSESGFDTSVNPMGVLFNPVSIASVLSRALDGTLYGPDDLFCDAEGVYHALDFESRRQDTDPQRLLDNLNDDFSRFADSLRSADRLLVTFGTAWCFRHTPMDRVVGNCHKLPDSQFERRLADIDQIVSLWTPLVADRRIIFTVSPVRHLNDGLHGNTLSKAILHLAVDRLVAQNRGCEYFPAYEAIVDDLRDYRFYADDLKHPSTMGEEYVFERFCETYMDRDTRARAEAARRAARRATHKPIITGL